MFTEHYRCGKKIGEMARIEPYEFDNQQQFRVGSDPIKILPGDAMVTTCKYTTTDLNSTLAAGLSTNDEMCVSFMSYYPSLPDESFLRACFSFENGVAFDRISLGPNAGGGSGGDAAVDPSAMAALLGDRFVLTSSNPLEGILTEFSSDPTTSWAPCCETNSCDTAFQAMVGEACGVDMDCQSNLVCDGGLCAELTDAQSEGNGSEGEGGESNSALPPTLSFLALAAIVILCSV
jgi:Copper type II ascorbate-dependent monooxygenase, C-terminal domain